MINKIALFLSSGMYSQVVKMCLIESRSGQVDGLLIAAIKLIEPYKLFDVIAAYKTFLEEDDNVFNSYDDEYYEYGCYSLKERNMKAENAKVLINAMLEKVKKSNMDNVFAEKGLTMDEEQEIKYCSKCGHELDDDGWCDFCGRFMEIESVFCSYCGSKTTINNFCSSCLQSVKKESKDVEEDVKYCPNCGNELIEDGWCDECLDFTLINPDEGHNSLDIDGEILVGCNAEYEEHYEDWETGNSWSSYGINKYYEANGEKVPLINIPENVVEIKEKVFKDCFSINGIRVPDSVKVIGEEAFRRSGIKHIRLSNNIKDIKYATFYECKSLKFVSLPKKIENLGSYAFAYSNIRKIRLPENLITIGDTAFFGCDYLEKIIIPENVLELPDSVFGCCDNLRMVKLPEGLKRIGKEAFSNCRELVNIEIPDGIEVIKGDAFQWCFKIKYNIYKNGKYLGNKNNPYLVLVTVDCETKNKDFEVHKDTKFILEAFTNVLACTSEDEKISILIPDSVEFIDPIQFHLEEKVKYNIYKNGKYLGNKNNPYLVFVDVVDKKVESLTLHDKTKINLYNFKRNVGESWRGLPRTFKFNEYNNGLYIGSENNPYFALIDVKDRSQKYEMHKDTKINYFEYAEKIR